MNELETLIRARIRDTGPMTFEAFMETALYYPGLGYYTFPETEIGRSGDFYTSPHLHPLFGAMLGRQAEEMWEVMDRPSEFTIVEAGGGRGWLAKDMLDYLTGRDIYNHLSYVLVELNPSMKERQSELLVEHGAKIRWAADIAELGHIAGVVVTNELLDALPVHLIESGKDGLKEIYVSLDGEKIVESPAPPSTQAIGAYLDEFGIRLPDRYRTEVNLRMKDWLTAASEILGEGFVLTIDYGYPVSELYSPERDRGTLMCYHRHQVNENPLINIGRQDITAHINFSALKQWGEDLGLKTVGFTRQGPYLVSLGIDEMLTQLMETSVDYRRDVSQVKGLIMPGGLGDTHKVLIQYKGETVPALRGFSLKNQADAL